MSGDNADQGPDTEQYLRYLTETDPLREQTNRDIIAWLDLPAGSRGLDIGCGCGTQALMLADAVGPRGHVTGLDLEPAFLEHARSAAEKQGLTDRTSFKAADLDRLPFSDSSFDWVWSSDCIGYLPVTRETVRVIKPGGSLNLSFWSAEKLLPGYPLLEARLGATARGIAPFTRGSRPESHHFRTLARLGQLGLTDLRAATFVTTVHAPMSEQIRQAMIDILEMRWPGVEEELSASELDLYRRITDPESPDFILSLPDYYGFFTYSAFVGVVPRSR